jgi:hypothetical protein
VTESVKSNEICSNSLRNTLNDGENNSRYNEYANEPNTQSANRHVQFGDFSFSEPNHISPPASKTTSKPKTFQERIDQPRQHTRYNLRKKITAPIQYQEYIMDDILDADK